MRSILDLCHGAPLRDFETGSVVLSEGESSGHLYVLKDGAVEVLRGKTQVAVVDEPGAVFGEMSALLHRPHTATVRAVTPIAVYAFDDAESFLESNPKLAFHIGQLLAARLNAATTYLADLKQQFEGHSDHLGMVGDVLDTLIHQQDEDFGSSPEPETDPRL